MKKQKIYLGLILLGLGLAGVLSILTVNIPLPPDVEALLLEEFTAGQIKWLLLVNPTILLLIAVCVGTALYEKVHLKVPLIESVLTGTKSQISLKESIRYGVVGGVLSGVLLSTIGLIFTPIIPTEFAELGESLKLTATARFLYGGITEEILMRFGVMTCLVWIASKVSKTKKAGIYWFGIIVAALIFAAGHLPVAYQAIASPSVGLVAYILIGNSIGGVIFGWLYWQKGLESAVIAHMCTHVVMLLVEFI